MTQRNVLMALFVVTLLAVLASWKVPTPEPEEVLTTGRIKPTHSQDDSVLNTDASGRLWVTCASGCSGTQTFEEASHVYPSER